MTEAILAADPSGVRPTEPTASGAIARFLAQFSARNRAEALHLAPRMRRKRTISGTSWRWPRGGLRIAVWPSGGC